MRRELPTLLLLAAVSISTGSVARESAIAPAPKRAASGRRAVVVAARSIGSPTDGKLEGAVALESGPEIRLRHPNGANYGLPALVGMLERSVAGKKTGLRMNRPASKNYRLIPCASA